MPNLSPSKVENFPCNIVSGESADRGPGYPRYTVSCSYPQDKFRGKPEAPPSGAER